MPAELLSQEVMQTCLTTSVTACRGEHPGDIGCQSKDMDGYGNFERIIITSEHGPLTM